MRGHVLPLEAECAASAVNSCGALWPWCRRWSPLPTADGTGKPRFVLPFRTPLKECGIRAFHVYVDGRDAALRVLAESERLLRDPSKPIDRGVAYELLYHLYNWHPFQERLPAGKVGLLELLQELRQFVAEDDREAILKTVENLQEVLEANDNPPDFDRP